MVWRRISYRHREIVPEDIFIDDSGFNDFDRTRFEGRIERSLTNGTFLTVTIGVMSLLVLLGARAAYVQLVRGSSFASRSANNSLEATEIFAPRGIIVDRNGEVLAENVDRPNGSLGRNYPIPTLGQIMGYVSYPKQDSKGNFYKTNITGVAGLESKYNDWLSGVNGKVLIEQDVGGNVRSSGTIVPVKQGSTLTLAMDAQMQKDLAHAIATTADRHGFIAGAGVVLDAETGEILAMVSHPSYDPNVISSGSPADVIARYNTSPGHPYIDHAVQGVYTPGSIVKPFLSAGALTDGIITPSTIINDPGQISLPDPYKPGKVYVFKGWKKLGLLTVDKAIAWSSDVFFYTVGGGFGAQKGLGIDRVDYWYRQFGFGTTTGVDVPEEAAGLIPTPEWKHRVLKEQWYLADTYFTSIGQYSMQVTPLQAARAAAAIANDGKLYVPTLRKPDVGATQPFTTVPITPEALRVVKSGMRQSVTSALAHMLNVPYVTVAAKTGTAQTGSRNQYDNSWVVGFFPYEKPHYAFAIVLERGPSGAGEQAVNAMRTFLDYLHEHDSVYVGGTGRVAATTTAAVIN